MLISKIKQVCDENNIDVNLGSVTALEEIDRETMERLSFLLSERMCELASGSAVLGYNTPGYERKENLMDLYKRTSSFLKVKNAEGYTVLARSFEEARDNISSKSSEELVEQLTDALQLYDELQSIKDNHRKYRVYRGVVDCIQASLQSVSFANEHPDMFSEEELRRLNKIRERFVELIGTTEEFSQRGQIKLDSGLVKRIEEIGIEEINKGLDQYDETATGIWQRYLNNPNENPQEPHYLVHVGLINGTYRKRNYFNFFNYKKSYGHCC